MTMVADCDVKKMKTDLMRLNLFRGVYVSDVIVSCCFTFDEMDKNFSAAVSYLLIIFC